MPGDSKYVRDELVEGVRKQDYVSPDQVLGQDVRIEELPDGVKFYIRGQSVDLESKRIVVNLYELRRVENGLKLRRDPLEKFINRIPDEDYVALEYGPCAPDVEGYMWIAKWKDLTGREKGVLSETFFISERWRTRYDAHQRTKAAKDAGAPVPAAAGGTGASPAPPAGGHALSAVDIIAIMQQGEERAIKNMERMAALLKASQNETPSEAMSTMYAAIGKVMEKTVESQLQTVRKVGEAANRAIDPPEEEEDEDDGGDMQATEHKAGLPAWLIPFMPKIEQALNHLLGGGPVAAGVKALIVTSEEWKGVFADPEKWGQAVAAMQEKFGPERTEKALAILLNKRAEKKGTKAKGGK